MFRQYMKNLLLISNTEILFSIMSAIEQFGEYDRNLGLEGQKSFCYLVEISGGLDYLEDLQKHPNSQIYNRVL